MDGRVDGGWRMGWMNGEKGTDGTGTDAKRGRAGRTGDPGWMGLWTVDWDWVLEQVGGVWSLKWKV